MLKKITILFSILIIFLFFNNVLAEEDLSRKLAGKILLQVENNGEAWYVNPANFKKYYLNRPQNAFDIMRDLSIGITNKDLNKIDIGLLESNNNDKDNDGLDDDLEYALGTNPQKADSDDDGFSDRQEIENNYNPLGEGSINIIESFTEKHLGKIFLQTENAGQAWYINPSDKKRYFLNRPADAFNIMKELGLGITNENINKITTGSIKNSKETKETTEKTTEKYGVIYEVATAIRSGDIEKTLTYFTPEIKKSIEYTMNFFDSGGHLIIGNILSNATLYEETENEKIYSSQVDFSLGGYSTTMFFHVKKQEDDAWLISNL